ncbi:hypothetical protein DRN87_02985 [Candidatus Geothermarchaeota archaeon]|nr:MAG: hypothetical protein DRN87_02985 [Candidatus Geothermarchaeota archaeon]HEW94221.1 hypothetical protein [Thermoprotei archaeon]
MSSLIEKIYSLVIRNILSFYTKNIIQYSKKYGIWKFKGVFPYRYTISGELLSKILSILKKLIIERGLRLNVIEIGAGSGILLKSIYNPNTYLVAIDISWLSCVNTLLNLGYKIDVICGDSAEMIKQGKFDIAYSNPPYMRCRPRGIVEYSYCGGVDLEIYRRIILSCFKTAKNGIIIFTNSKCLSGIEFSSNFFPNIICKPILTSNVIGIEEVKVHVCRYIGKYF